MSQQALKAAATGTAVTTQTERPKTLAQLLVDPAVKAQLALALPRHMTADRLARIALTEIRKVPKLAQCDQTSFLGAIMQCAALGLEPGGALGHAYLLPFDKREKDASGRWRTVGTEVQLIVGYRGMIDLARRSGQIQSLEARAVYQADHFEVELGLDSTIVHRPAWEVADRGPLVFAYAVAKLKDGGVQFDVMSRAEIEKIRARSKAKDNGPWTTDFDEMAKKTVVRRLFKYLPVSIELQTAVGLDERAELGIPQDNALLLDAGHGHVLTHEQDREAGEAPAQDAGGDGAPITLAEIVRAIETSGTLDELDVAVDLVRMLPEAERAAANEAHRQRRIDLADR